MFPTVPRTGRLFRIKRAAVSQLRRKTEFDLFLSYPILSYLSIYLISIFSYNITHRVTKSAQYAK
jgi:hypothetical protein